MRSFVHAVWSAINALRTFTVVKSTTYGVPLHRSFFLPSPSPSLSSAAVGTATPNMTSVRFFSAEKEVKVPSMGDSITEGALIEWNKSECGCG